MKISKEKKLELFEKMLLIRHFEQNTGLFQFDYQRPLPVFDSKKAILFSMVRLVYITKLRYI